VTIPVPNPPRYEPGAPPPKPSEEEARAIAERTAAELQLEVEAQRARALPRRKGGRGCLASMVMLGLLAACCGGFVAWGLLGGGFDEALRQTGEKIAADLRTTAEEQGRLEGERPAIDGFEQLVRDRRVTWIAFSILFNRWQDARADRRIDPAELDRLMLLVRDIGAHGGDVDPAVYPEGR
jgi:hypothetical protein